MFDRQDLENVITKALTLLNHGDVVAAQKLLDDTNNEINRLYETNQIYRNSGTR